MTTKRRPRRSVDPVPVFHPALLALFPVLGLYANNLAVSPWSSVWRAVVLAPVAAMAAWFVIALIIRSVHKAAVITSLLIVMSMPGWRILEFAIRRLRPLVNEDATAWWYGGFVLIAVLVLAAVAYRFRGDVRRSTKAVGWTALALVCVPLAAEILFRGLAGRTAAWLMAVHMVVSITLVVLVLRLDRPFKTTSRTFNWFGFILVTLYILLIFMRDGSLPQAELPPVEAEAAVAEEDRPDIYLLLLEGYPRPDVLAKSGYNTMFFLGDMAELGLASASGALANYDSEEPSIAALMNVGYVHELNGEHMDRRLMAHLFRNNRLAPFLREQGYQICAFSPGVDALEPTFASDVRAPVFSMTEFELVFLDDTAFRPLLQALFAFRHGNPAYWRYEPLRRRVMLAFEQLPLIAAEETGQPRFTLAYIPLPAPPFLFTREGERARPHGPRAPGDAAAFQGSEAEFAAGYMDQLLFLNKQLRDVVAGIREASARPSVVIIASAVGFGPGGADIADNPELAPGRYAVMTLWSQERPDGTPMESVSHVNLLRRVLADSLGAELGPLEEEFFYYDPAAEAVLELPKTSLRPMVPDAAGAQE